MGVIHHRDKNFAIYVPPKCGTWLFDALVDDYPEYRDIFYIDSTHDLDYRRKRIFVVRNHYRRILSTYYEKIVDPKSESDTFGWRAGGNSGPDKKYGPEKRYSNFLNYVSNLGAQSWDSHVRPYFSFPWFSTAWYAKTHDVSDCMLFETKHLGETLKGINYVLGLPANTGKSTWEEVKKKTSNHKMPYSHFLPAPDRYGAPSWECVHWSQLYQCYLDNGALPSYELMFSVGNRSIRQIRNQIGYMLDDSELSSRTGARILSESRG